MAGPHHLQKPFWGVIFQVCIVRDWIAERGIYSLCGRKSAHFRNRQPPPLCKETPGVYIAWERLRPKIGAVSDDLQHDAVFPQHTEFSAALLVARISIWDRANPEYLQSTKLFQEFQLEELIGQKVFQFRIKLYRLLEIILYHIKYI